MYVCDVGRQCDINCDNCGQCVVLHILDCRSRVCAGGAYFVLLPMYLQFVILIIRSLFSCSLQLIVFKSSNDDMTVSSIRKIRKFR